MMSSMTEESRRGRVYVETFGCAFNQGDSRIMKGLLQEGNYEVVDEPREAEMIVVNTCYVKEPTEHRVIHRIRSLQKMFPEKSLLVAGCMVEIDPDRLERIAPSSSWLGPHQLNHVTDAVDHGIKGERVRFTGTCNVDKPMFPRFRENPLIEIVQISEGCLGSCNYCCTRFARGNLHSYPIEALVREVEAAVGEGCREVWLTAQDTGCYGSDIETSLPQLIRETCRVEGEFFLRVGMMNPSNAYKVLDRLVESFEDEKVFKFLHLPIQSMSPRILHLMGRNYSADTVREIVERFRSAFPHLTLSTDIIVGYPTENDDDFEETLSFIEEIEPDIVNISKFGPRPRTEAAKLDQLPRDMVKKRCKRLVNTVKTLSKRRNRRWLGWRGRCLIDEKGKKGDTWIGRNYAYKPIVIEERRSFLGSYVEVEVVEVHSTYLKGEPRRLREQQSTAL